MSMYQRRLGKYELQERVGSGASELWKAFDTQQRRYVAIKILPVNAQTSADCRRPDRPIPRLSPCRTDKG